ncbi:MAG: type VI secretion system contractile sheath large subunit [Casimicrobiaceae bacterium]
MGKERMQFDMTFGRSRGTGTRHDDEDPMRILVLGNFSGHGDAQRTPPFAQRLPIAVDIDNLDKVLARLAPQLELAFDGVPVTIEFHSIDDFHPDRLFERLAPFVALRKLRAELNDAATYQRAAQALGARPSAAASPPGNTKDATADIERLLGRRQAVAPAAATGVDIQDWLRTIVAPHIVPDDTEQRQLIGGVDAALAEQMRRVLHHPSFQALEAAWRGIDRLVRELETGETLQVFLLDASRDDLVRDTETAAADPSQSSLYRHLCGPATQTPAGDRWSLLVVDHAFGIDADDVRLLAILGALAAQSGAPLLAAARLDVLGCAGVLQLSEPKSWTPSDAQTHWGALRKSVAAPAIGLALPRILARLPYGAASDPIESFAFEELPQVRDHEAYLWGNPAFALALLAGQAFEEDGWDLDLERHIDAAGLPTHIYREDGEAKQQPCAEVLISESAGEAILARGLMPLLSYRNRDAARLLRWQSVAEPAQALQGAWVAVGPAEE